MNEHSKFPVVTKAHVEQVYAEWKALHPKMAAFYEAELSTSVSSQQEPK